MNDNDVNTLIYLEVCEELQLRSPGAGGIENADGFRVSEFITYISQRPSLPFSVRYTLVELVIASMNEAIVKNLTNDELHAAFDEYIKSKLNDERYYPHIPYWISIKSQDEFPIGFLIEKYSEPSLDEETDFM
ncbi:MAG: hypothetical protein AB8G22_03350 [Saprospiraceae bacterium]